MKINVTFLGPEVLAYLRHDLMVLLKHSLEELGHKVAITRACVEAKGWLNIIIGGYFINHEGRQSIMQSGADIIHLNTEVIKNDLLNFNPQKVDFLGSYLPFLHYGRGILEMVVDNMPEHERYGTHAAFLRWAYHEKLEDLNYLSAAQRDYDFYLFGMLTERRMAFIKALQAEGYVGITHNTCPRWERNSFIERTRINLNIIQEEVYSHVNCFRIGYLANNRCAILSEQEHDPAGYLTTIKVTDKNHFLEDFAQLLENNAYLEAEQATYYHYRQTHFTPILEKALDAMF